MSIELSTLVWKGFGEGGAKKLVMLALADFANRGSELINPSIRTLAAKICCSDSQARRTLHKLIDEGWVEVAGNCEGGSPGTSRQYRLNVERLRAAAKATVSRTTSTGASRPDSQTTGADATPAKHETAGADATRWGAGTGRTNARTGSDASQTLDPNPFPSQEKETTPVRYTREGSDVVEETLIDGRATAGDDGLLDRMEA